MNLQHHLNKLDDPGQLQIRLTPPREAGRRYYWLPIITAIFTLLMGAWALLDGGTRPLTEEYPTHYAYQVAQLPSGITLHSLVTAPDNIKLIAVATNMLATENYGINGGFFYQDSLLSIAVNDDIPAGGEERTAASGWFNVKYARGTLIWDKLAQGFMVQVVSSADEFVVADRSRYWAQGGISMSLGDDAGWHAQAEREHMPGLDLPHMRSALVFDRNNQVRLYVTQDRCTGEQFRSAIKESGGVDLIDGIFLDGDGSSQMKADGVNLPGDQREIRQIISIIN
jgi:hypothetical protein